jgi:hypothetical protein
MSRLRLECWIVRKSDAIAISYDSQTDGKLGIVRKVWDLFMHLSASGSK